MPINKCDANMKDRKLKKEILNKWNYLVSHFTPDYIFKYMQKEEYVIGTGADNSFCYLVEVALKSLGDIRGATSAKFGLWYGTHGKDKTRKFRSINKFSSSGNIDEAFENIKMALIKLIKETIQLSEFKDLKSSLSSMFKYKIMYLYNPNIMLPSFVKEDLFHFEEKLGLNPSKTYEKAQKQLIEYKKDNYPNISNHDFMAKLYTKFGRYNIDEIKSINDSFDDKLNKVISKNKKDPKDEYVTHVEPKQSAKKAEGGVYYYPRNPKMAAYALKNAQHKCENNIQHECFIRRSNGMPYTEVHHLVPLCYYDDFENVSLDVPENIVSLCSNCHNEIHYGKNADQLITKLYNERKAKLLAAGIDISLDELLNMYHKLNSHE